jgi:hypothetical protein
MFEAGLRPAHGRRQWPARHFQTTILDSMLSTTTGSVLDISRAEITTSASQLERIIRQHHGNVPNDSSPKH